MYNHVPVVMYVVYFVYSNQHASNLAFSSLFLCSSPYSQASEGVRDVIVPYSTSDKIFLRGPRRFVSTRHLATAPTFRERIICCTRRILNYV